jgi:hypothetical protein
MSTLFVELLERLKSEDELTLLEILDLSSMELVDLLESTIFDKQQRVWDYYDETDAEGMDWEKIPDQSE